MWFTLESVPLDFADSSPHSIDNEVVIDASPERVFEIVVREEGIGEWLTDYVSSRWTSSIQHGVGATREIRLKMLAARERILAWDAGRRFAFHVYALSAPLVTAMIEDLQFLPAGDGRTRLVWRVHYRPTLLMRAVHPLARTMLGKMFARSAEALARYAAAHPGPRTAVAS